MKKSFGSVATTGGEWFNRPEITNKKLKRPRGKILRTEKDAVPAGLWSSIGSTIANELKTELCNNNDKLIHLDLVTLQLEKSESWESRWTLDWARIQLYEFQISSCILSVIGLALIICMQFGCRRMWRNGRALSREPGFSIADFTVVVSTERVRHQTTSQWPPWMDFNKKRISFTWPRHVDHKFGKIHSTQFHWLHSNLHSCEKLAALVAKSLRRTKDSLES